MKRFALFLALVAPLHAHAKTCTESDIRKALGAGSAFVYAREGCTNPSGIITIKNGINIKRSGWLFDGSGVARLVWKGAGGCDKTPRTAEYAFFDFNGNNNTVRGFSAEGAPEGIHISTGKNNVIEGVSYPFICEDAITNGTKKSNSATGSIVRDSRFRGSDDKAIQVNGGTITVEGCDFKDVYRSVGMCSVKADPGHHEAKPCGYKSTIYVRHNRIQGCNGYAIRSAGKDSAKGGVLIAEGNVISDCDNPIQVEEEGYAEARDNELYDCKQAIKTLTSKGSALLGCGNKIGCRKDYAGPGKVKVQTGCK